MDLARGEGEGNVLRPSDAGLKMFKMAQYNIFIPHVKKAGGTTLPLLFCRLQALGLGEMEVAGRVWQWTPTWSEVMRVGGGFDPAVANRGAYAGVVQGITHRPKARPRPGARGLISVATTGTPSPKPCGRSAPPWTWRERYVGCVLA